MPANCAPNVFRNAYHFQNSRESVFRFPYPFETDQAKMRVNVAPHDRTGPTAAFHALFDIDEHYLSEIEERNYLLAQRPYLCQVSPHMRLAEWDVLELIMEALAEDFPQHFSLQKNGGEWLWTNHLLKIQRQFIFGDDQSFPDSPLDYIARQGQGDLLLMEQRDGDLWLEGGCVTQAFGWSFDFIMGMSWNDWHGPVMKKAERDVIDRSRRMSMSLQVGAPIRRVNWLMQTKPRLDRNLDTKLEWRLDDAAFQKENIGSDLFLRTEFQQLYRLPRSNAVLFGLRHYMLSFNELLMVPKWAKRTHRVLRDLDPNSERYESTFARLDAIEWLARYDDGAVTSHGFGPDLDGQGAA